jgi:hypothetical protein
MSHRSIVALSLLLLFDKVNAAEMTEFSATGTAFKFAIKLDAPLPSGMKVKLDFGKGLKAMNCSGQNCTLTSSSLPLNVASSGYKVGIYNSKNVLQSVLNEGSYTIKSMTTFPTTAPAPTISSGMGYTKIANDGSALDDNAKLGIGVKDWACTKDNKTGLIWEVKTNSQCLTDTATCSAQLNDDVILRDVRRTYGGYTPDYDPYNLYKDSYNVYQFVLAVNSKGLCGTNNWRLPTKQELLSIVYCSDGKSKTIVTSEENGELEGYNAICTGSPAVPTISTTYFPNTAADAYWTSSSSDFKNGTWMVSFSPASYYSVTYKNNTLYARLVH